MTLFKHQQIIAVNLVVKKRFLGPNTKTRLPKKESAKITHPDIHQAGPFFGTLVLLFQRYHSGAQDQPENKRSNKIVFKDLPLKDVGI